MKNHLKIMAGSSNPELVQEICEYLDILPGRQQIERSPNGNIKVKIQENVREDDVFVLQTSSPPVNDNFIELLLLIDALKYASARRITAILPYFPYVRSDKKDEPRAPISAKLLANLLESTKIDRLVSIDLHAAQIQGFLDTPFDNLYSAILVIDKLDNTIFKNLTLDERQKKFIVVSPDAGGAKRTLALAKHMKLNTIMTLTSSFGINSYPKLMKKHK